MKVYISATFRDLQRHRLAVASVLRRMGHQVVGMEDYVAEGARPLKRCLEDVASSDAYVGIFAWRYGSISEDGKLSITERELQHAKATLGEEKVLLFLLDPDAEWPASQIDALSGDGTHIARLRREISESHLISHFRTPEDLAGLVSAAVYRLEMSRQLQFEQLAAATVQHLKREVPVDESSLMEITTAMQQDVQVLQINLGAGTEWWMTRLYLLASLASELAAVEAIVFLEGETFAGMAHPELVKERLSALDPAFAQYEQAVAAPAAAEPELSRRVRLWKEHVQNESVDPVYVTRADLGRWFRHGLITHSIDCMPGDDDAVQMQRIMDWPMRFVPLSEDGRFERIVDKQALAEKVARMFVREQVSRALSMTRR